MVRSYVRCPSACACARRYSRSQYFGRPLQLYNSTHALQTMNIQRDPGLRIRQRKEQLARVRGMMQSREQCALVVCGDFNFPASGEGCFQVSGRLVHPTHGLAN
eukprot:6649776-Pyramimonas_sp.AAC.1